jgi:hypothetical protein
MVYTSISFNQKNLLVATATAKKAETNSLSHDDEHILILPLLKLVCTQVNLCNLPP